MTEYILRYGSLRMLGIFTARDNDQFTRNQQVLAKTARGVELAEVLCEATDHTSKDLQPDLGGCIVRQLDTADGIETRFPSAGKFSWDAYFLYGCHHRAIVDTSRRALDCSTSWRAEPPLRQRGVHSPRQHHARRSLGLFLRCSAKRSRE